jgi:hypothetical protein
MTRNLETRIAKLEQWRSPRPPYVVRMDFPFTAEDRAAVCALPNQSELASLAGRRLYETVGYLVEAGGKK